MDTSPPALTARFWRTRRSAAVAGIVFAVLMLTAMTMMRLALGDADPHTLKVESHQRRADWRRSQFGAVRRDRLSVVHRRRPRPAGTSGGPAVLDGLPGQRAAVPCHAVPGSGHHDEPDAHAGRNPMST